jgi:hypothetical protein
LDFTEKVDTKNFSSKSTRRITFAVACIGLVLMLGYRMGPAVVDPDIWHQMALIRDAIGLGYLPYEDHFAYTETRYPCVQHEWGAGVIALVLSKGTGATGIVILRLVLTAAMFSLVIVGSRILGVSTTTLIFLAPLPILLIDRGFSTVRAQMYSFVCLEIFLIFLQFNRHKWRWWLPVWLLIYIFWVNVHAGFLVGVGMASMWWLEQVLRRQPHRHLLYLLLAMVVLISATPYGLHYYSYLWLAITMGRPHVSEWMPIYQSNDWSHLLFYIVSLILAGYGLLARGFTNSKGVFLVAAGAIAALRASRMECFYAIVWIFFVPEWLQHTRFGFHIKKLFSEFPRFMIGFWIVVAVIFLIRLQSLQPLKLHVPGDHRPEFNQSVIYPVGPVDYLTTNSFKGELLVPFDWGAYVIWKLYPQVKVSLDSRYEVTYPEHVVEEQQRLFTGAVDWRRLLSKYATDAILVHVNLPLTNLLPNLPKWKMVYKDKLWELYVPEGSDLPIVQYPEQVFEGKFP